MTTTFIIPCILFLLATFAWHSKAETHWTTDSNEEEEKRQNILFGNESFQTSNLPIESSTKPSLIKLLAMGRNILRNRGSNFSEYDELLDESKNDASPENSVDKDSLENVNYFLQENPDIETSTQLDLKRERPTTTQLDLKGERPTTTQLDLKGERPTTTQLDLKGERPTTTQLDLKGERPTTTQLDLKGERPTTTQLDLKGERTTNTQLDLKGERPTTTHLDLKRERPTTTHLDLKRERPTTIHLDFKRERPTTIHLDLKREPPTTESSELFLNREANTYSSLDSSNQNNKELPASFSCESGDENCKSAELASTGESEPRYGEKILPSTSITLSPSLWNMVKSLKPQDRSSDFLPAYTSTYEMSELVTPTLSRSDSTSSDQTSENIVIDEIELSKDESAMQSHSNKSDKLKLLKPDITVDELSEENTLLKVTLAPSISHIKETTFLPDVRLLSSLLFTKILNISTTSSPITTMQTPFLFSPIGSRVESKSNVYLSSRYIIDEKQIGDFPSAEYPKELLDYTTPVPGITSTQLRYNAKSNIPLSEYKPTKVYSEKLPDMTPVIFPSFQDSTSWIMTTSVPSVEPILQSFSSLDVSSSAVQSSPVVTTPAFESETPSQPAAKESTVLTTMKEELELPPRLSNPSCSSLPVCIEITLLETTWEQFCGQIHEFRQFLSTSVSHYTRPIRPHHIVLDAEVCTTGSIRPLQTTPDISVAVYVTDDSGEYEERMTEICGVILRKWAPTSFRSSVMEVHLYSSESQSTPLPLIPELNSGFVAAVSISAVAGVALCLLCILLVIMKQKLVQGRNSDTTTPTADAYSLDSLSINASFRRRRTRRSARSYLNHAFSDQEIPSHPLNEKSLKNCLKSRDLLEEEFRKIPMNMPKLDAIPEGAHVKNRYSNILPKPESRVLLAEPSGDPLKCYINANYVKGYEGKSAFYIACQAPLPEGIEDFWRMVWEQQCRVIIMLTQFEENGVSRCAMYFPQSTLVTQPPFGDFQISLLKKEVYEFYTMSTLRLLDIEKNLFRDIVHLWFTGWPDVGVPKDPSSLITFVQQCRSYINCNAGPTIVHCSTGTGRTGVYLTLDICMREYEESRSIDILQCVSQLRRDRGGAVQNKDQYILIYEAMLEYISRVSNQSECPSVNSKNS